jgi:tetratricopeptide (TPR) repeat protein
VQTLWRQDVPKIFISYRRDDSSGYVGHLREKLGQHFGDQEIFRDIDTIEPGQDFSEAIEQAISSCEVLLAVIGKQWLTLTDVTGQRRIDDPEDFVRIEIATALRQNIRIIPVLVGGATMPSADLLPQDLKLLARRNAKEISDRSFYHDVEALIQVIDKLFLTSGLILTPVDTQSPPVLVEPTIATPPATPTIQRSNEIAAPKKAARSMERAPARIKKWQLLLSFLAIGALTVAVMIVRSLLNPPADPLSPASAPETGAFHIVVANFTDISDTTTNNQLGEQVGSAIFQAITSSYEDEELSTDLVFDHAATFIATGEQALRLARERNADIMIYGSIEESEPRIVVSPGIYVSPSVLVLFPELVDLLTTNSFTFELGPENNNVSRTDLIPQLDAVIRIVYSLSEFFSGRYSNAQSGFAYAARLEGIANPAILYTLAGTAAIRAQDYNAALGLYQTAIQRNPEYSRAWSGRGTTFLQMANNAPSVVVTSEANNLETASNMECTTIGGWPTEPNLLAELAELCYEHAYELAQIENNSELQIEFSFLLGQLKVWQSTRGYNDYWDEAEAYLTEAVNLYIAAPEDVQKRVGLSAAHAYALLGLRISAAEELNYSAVVHAIEYYTSSLTLLRNDINRVYNQPSIELYEARLDELNTLLPRYPSPTPTQAIVVP